MVEYLKFTPETSNNWFRAWVEIQKQKPWLMRRLLDASTESQIESKLWLATEIKNLNLQPKNCVLLGGWFAHIITSLLIDELGVEFVMNYEIDRDVQYASFKFNRRYKEDGKYRCIKKNVMTEQIGKLGLVTNPKIEKRYKASDYGTGFEINNKIISYDCIINTSCEHMFPMKKWKEINYYALENLRGFKKNPYYILQSTNDNQYDDHINCVRSPEELADQAELVDILYSGSKILSNGMERFMLIGR